MRQRKNARAVSVSGQCETALAATNRGDSVLMSPPPMAEELTNSARNPSLPSHVRGRSRTSRRSVGNLGHGNEQVECQGQIDRILGHVSPAARLVGPVFCSRMATAGVYPRWSELSWRLRLASAPLIAPLPTTVSCRRARSNWERLASTSSLSRQPVSHAHSIRAEKVGEARAITLRMSAGSPAA